MSDGGVHSHIEHLYALLKLAKDNGLSDVYVDALLDGRDVPPASGAAYIEALQKKMAEIGVGRISTVAGRYYGMDRDNRWDRIEKEYNACVLGDGIMADDAVEAVRKSYETVDADGKHLTDEFVIPTVIAGGKGYCGRRQHYILQFPSRPCKGDNKNLRRS